MRFDRTTSDVDNFVDITLIMENYICKTKYTREKKKEQN